jgi:LPS sulfotransferase NodH
MNRAGYGRFMIIGKMRSGTTYVQSLLASHDQIEAHGEVLNVMGAHRNQMYDVVRAIVDEPAAFVNRTVFHDYPQHIRAVGFKTVYEQVGVENAFLYEMETRNVGQAIREQRESLWRFMQASFDLTEARQRSAQFLDWLANSRDLAILHVKRRNKLAMLLSERATVLSGAWNSEMGAYGSDPVRLEFEECRRFFMQAEQAEKRFDQLFHGHDALNIVYEDLLEDTGRLLQDVQVFLGVDVRQLSSGLHKQMKVPLAQAISNYSQLRERFSGTRWSTYFET